MLLNDLSLGLLLFELASGLAEAFGDLSRLLVAGTFCETFADTDIVFVIVLIFSPPFVAPYFMDLMPVRHYPFLSMAALAVSWMTLPHT